MNSVPSNSRKKKHQAVKHVFCPNVGRMIAMQKSIDLGERCDPTKGKINP